MRNMVALNNLVVGQKYVLLDLLGDVAMTEIVIYDGYTTVYNSDLEWDYTDRKLEYMFRYLGNGGRLTAIPENERNKTNFFWFVWRKTKMDHFQKTLLDIKDGENAGIVCCYFPLS